MAAFVTPAILVERWAAYRSPYRAFADQLNTSVSLPEFGMEIYIPVVTTGSTVNTQTEGSELAEGDPVANFASSEVVTKDGKITLSQQFLDRAGPGIAGDAVLFAQLKNQLDAQVDTFSLERALSGAQAVTNNGSFGVTTASGVGGFVGDLKKAKRLIGNLAGVKLRATHAFGTGNLVDYVSAYADAQGRPVFTPSFDDDRLPIRSVGDQTPQGYTGYVLTGLALFEDSNIPNVGTTSTTQVVVCRADTIALLEGAPVPFVYAPTVAGSLEPVLGMTEYVAMVVRYRGESVATITGTAYSASTFA
jgi:hypothetical protein